MAQTTWKQVVHDVADAYREANGTTDKIPVGELTDKVRAGVGTPYTGDNPLTLGQDGYTLPAKTLLKDGLQIINGVNGEGQHVWKQLTAEGGDFVAFVTADDENSYPDGGEQDGYWYELVEEGMNLLSICGFTEIAIDTFTPSNNIKLGNRNTLSHSLNKNPKFFIILCDIESAPTGISDAVACGMSIVGATTSGPYIAFNELKDRNGNHGAYYEYLDPNEPVTANSIKFWATDTNYYFKAGVTYTLITMA